jgi:2,5-diamino-6-(ribosylamino)-4(3H)-pyrimidinone 5'-phosphate reductase
MMLPRVILHNAISADGRMDRVDPDLGLFYGIASRFEEEATLAGSNTMMTAYGEEASEPDEGDYAPPRLKPDDNRPLLVVPDSRGRLRNWHLLRKERFWRDVIALVSSSTPGDYLDYLDKLHVEYIMAGDDHVDIRAALEELNSRHGVKVVRADCGGILNGILLREGLVNEVSLLVEPALIGGMSSHYVFQAPDLDSAEGVIALKLKHLEKIDGDVVWLLYEVAE